MNRYLLLLAGLVASLSADADYLRVSRKASVKVQANSSAAVVVSVEEDALLDLLDNGDQVNGYYHVKNSRLFSGSGWIYKTFVRRFYGDMPLPVTQDDILNNPVMDATYKLTDQEKTYAASHLRIGKPQAIYERIYEGYVTAQDSRLKLPSWVQYELRPENLDGPAVRRNTFRPDTSIPRVARADVSDYAGSGYDQGHMAPAEDMSRSDKVMDESFLLSNMAPQVGVHFNQHIWAYLELATRGWVRQRGTLTIITGPVFQPKNGTVSYKTIGANNVAVPTHFYKIIVDANQANDVQVLAFLLPNEAIPQGNYINYLVSVREIELLTGLDFLSALPKATQDRVETQRADGVW